MKKILFFGVALLLMFASCSKDDDPVVDPVRYYVKYEVVTDEPYRSKIINYSTEKGNQSDTITNKNWEETFGPITKDFIASLECIVPSNPFSSDAQIQLKIYMSREKEPFVLKAMDSGFKSVSVKYKIDF